MAVIGLLMAKPALELMGTADDVIAKVHFIYADLLLRHAIFHAV